MIISRKEFKIELQSCAITFGNAQYWMEAPPVARASGILPRGNGCGSSIPRMLVGSMTASVVVVFFLSLRARSMVGSVVLVQAWIRSCVGKAFWVPEGGGRICGCGW